MFARHPWQRDLPSWYPPIGKYDTVLRRLRQLGLYGDGHLVWPLLATPAIIVAVFLTMLTGKEGDEPKHGLIKGIPITMSKEISTLVSSFGKMKC